MNKLAGVLAGLLVPAFFVAGVIATPAMAQEKAAKKMEKAAAGKVTLKERMKNDKVRVYEATFKPGDEAPSVERPRRVVIYIKGGTLQRIYPDGKKENTPRKDGEVQFFEPTPAYAVKNVGKTTVHLYGIEVK